MSSISGSEIEVFLDETPGETRLVIARDGRFERLLIERETDVPAHRLGARSVGRVAEVQSGLGAAFVDLGVGAPFGFLPLGKAKAPPVGAFVEVEVSAEPRERKGPVLRLIGPAEGPARLLSSGPSICDQMAITAPRVEPITGVAAIQASWDAEEEALGQGDIFAEWGLDLAVQRTRALVAVDIDHAPVAGRDPRRARAEANRQGLLQAARLIRLKGWGGTVAIDLAGTGFDGAKLTEQARAAFAGDEAVMGPLSRFGVLQLALPWRRTPIEERLLEGGRPSLETRAIGAVRLLRHALLSDRAAPRLTLVCSPEEAERATPLAARLGPRALVQPDPSRGPGRASVEEA
ncbi:RNA-binding protein [Brevundimonas sp. 2R-24]|uniref:RNA-binding protein n=1 Tax=Peiella sedimenti TaxID=3061083 RepID=A0ABT8SP73_9CAUL|nr:RNA-binding protein [Caulobacteraceae bacterium XZ-24]